MRKKCSKCGKNQNIINNFYKSYSSIKGKQYYHSYCKKCLKKYAHAWKLKNIEYFRKRDRAGRRRYRKNHPELRFGRKKWSKRHYEEWKVNQLVSKAIKSGKIEKQPCEVCGDGNVHAHHSDYSKPLDVQWLCPLHHKELHAKVDKKKANQL